MSPGCRWSKRVKHPSKMLNVGSMVESMVLGVDPQARRIAPWA